MKLDLTKYTFEELITIKNSVNDYLYSYSDGYIYICEVRSFGRNWTERVSNVYNLEELCDYYSGGDNGIVDVYTNNPDLGEFYNYGGNYYIPSEDDYAKWKEYETLKRLVRDIKLSLDEWDNRDNVPFNRRPYFAPIYSREELSEMEKELSEFDMSFIPPLLYSNR